jgi:thiamine-phosphate pyrophosphorylase
MASQLARRKLAIAAHRLNEAYRGFLPALIFLTDDERVLDPMGAAGALPKGSAIVLRCRNPSERADLGRVLVKIARERDLILLVAGDVALARQLEADGIHLSEEDAELAGHCRRLQPEWLITASAHSEGAILDAFRADADAVLLAPVFPTKSHPDKPCIGIARACQIAARSPLPVYALGGVTADNIGRLTGAAFAGVAAIEGLLPG